jgi:hypothetical protein
LTEEIVRRAFRFDRAFANREAPADLARQIELARDRGVFPSRLAVTWR